MNAALEAELVRYVAKGYHICFVGSSSAIVERKGYSTGSFAFNALLTFFTFGLWLIPWFLGELVHAATSRRVLLTLEDNGTVRRQRADTTPDEIHNRYGINKGLIEGWANFKAELRK